MGYRDDFYCEENFIGYSGDLHRTPTAYFQSDSGFGHITQAHPLPQNVGREPVESSDGYEIGNETIGGTLKLVEKMNGEIFHESRSVLTTVEEMSAGDKAVALQAIWNCPNEKQISTWSTNDLNIVDNQMALKNAALEGLPQG